MNPKETKPIPHNDEHAAVEQLQDWETRERVKPPWTSTKYGKTVKPPNEQDNPQPLTTEMVLQPRAEKIGNSAAPPISGRGQDKGMVETSRSKQIHHDSGGAGL
jgi:hypothetical protein